VVVRAGARREGVRGAAPSQLVPEPHRDRGHDEELSDALLWKAVYGEHAMPPRPGPNASAAEPPAPRAARRALHAGRHVSAGGADDNG
jgi:hypothetical protein